MTKIIVDCFGGDHSPDAPIDGSIAALTRYPELEIILTGDEAILSEKLKSRSYDSARLSVVHAPDVITGEEKPTDAIRLKKESSMMKAIRLLHTDSSIAGMISTGSSGALVAGATIRVGRIFGVQRPAFCPILPTMNGGIVGICDTGASVDVSPAYLQQFAVMGSLYLKNVYGIPSPRVALLNIGTEAGKGDELHRAAYSLLTETPGVNFVGNMESRDLLSGRYDLVVCDGFSGNVLVKATEGTALELLKKLKVDLQSKPLYKLGALLLYKMFMAEKEFMNYQNYGGSVLLGASKVIVKGHGSSKAVAVEKCIEQAYQMETSGLNGQIEAALAAFLPTNGKE